MTAWLDRDRLLLDQLEEIDSNDGRVEMLIENIKAGENVLATGFDTRLTCDVMMRLATSYLLLAEERQHPADAEMTATWAIRAGRRALHNDVDTATIVPRALAVIAGVLGTLEDGVRHEAVAQTEELLAGYSEALTRLHERSSTD